MVHLHKALGCVCTYKAQYIFNLLYWLRGYFFVGNVMDLSNYVIPEERIIRMVHIIRKIRISRKMKTAKYRHTFSVEKLSIKPRALLSEQHLVLCCTTRFAPVLNHDDMQKQIFVSWPRLSVHFDRHKRPALDQCEQGIGMSKNQVISKEGKCSWTTFC